MYIIQKNTSKRKRLFPTSRPKPNIPRGNEKHPKCVDAAIPLDRGGERGYTYK